MMKSRKKLRLFAITKRQLKLAKQQQSIDFHRNAINDVIQKET